MDPVNNNQTGTYVNSFANGVGSFTSELVRGGAYLAILCGKTVYNVSRIAADAINANAPSLVKGAGRQLANGNYVVPGAAVNAVFAGVAFIWPGVRWIKESFKGDEIISFPKRTFGPPVPNGTISAKFPPPVIKLPEFEDYQPHTPPQQTIQVQIPQLLPVNPNQPPPAAPPSTQQQVAAPPQSPVQIPQTPQIGPAVGALVPDEREKEKEKADSPGDEKEKEVENKGALAEQTPDSPEKKDKEKVDVVQGPPDQGEQGLPVQDEENLLGAPGPDPQSGIIQTPPVIPNVINQPIQQPNMGQPAVINVTPTVTPPDPNIKKTQENLHKAREYLSKLNEKNLQFEYKLNEEKKKGFNIWLTDRKFVFNNENLGKRVKNLVAGSTMIGLGASQIALGTLYPLWKAYFQSEQEFDKIPPDAVIYLTEALNKTSASTETRDKIFEATQKFFAEQSTESLLDRASSMVAQFPGAFAQYVGAGIEKLPDDVIQGTCATLSLLAGGFFVSRLNGLWVDFSKPKGEKIQKETIAKDVTFGTLALCSFLVGGLQFYDMGTKFMTGQD